MRGYYSLRVDTMHRNVVSRFDVILWSERLTSVSSGRRRR
jgi:hypothetical protein